MMKKILSIALAGLLALTLAGAAVAETVAPNPVSFSAECPSNRCVLTDIRDLGNGQAELTLYETETFPAAKIEALKAGDEIVTEGVSCMVVSVKKDEFGDYILNEGTPDELRLWKYGADGYAVTGDDDAHPLVQVGKRVVELNDYMTVVDFIDPATGEQLENAVIRSGKDMKENMKKDELVQFDSRNVYVVYEAGGAPWIVIRSYAPWQ